MNKPVNSTRRAFSLSTMAMLETESARRVEFMGLFIRGCLGERRSAVSGRDAAEEAREMRHHHVDGHRVLVELDLVAAVKPDGLFVL